MNLRALIFEAGPLAAALRLIGVRDRGLPASQMAAILTYGAGTTPASEAPAQLVAARGVTAEETCDAANHA